MKYTNYVLNEKFVNLDNIRVQVKIPILKPPVFVLSAMIALFGLIVLSGLMPFALLADEYRYGKYRYIINKRKYEKF